MQNAVIGPDNSLVGGLIGAAVLIAVNALWERVATSSDGTARVIEGSPTILVRDGVPDRSAISRVGLRVPEVMAACTVRAPTGSRTSSWPRSSRAARSRWS